MITDINLRSRIGPDLRPEKLEPYWQEYFHYRDAAPDLHSIVEGKLTEELDEARGKPSPFLDSQQVIARVLTVLGASGSFHRQFGERFPDFKPNQTLGMQLYALIASDAELWIYSPTKHAGHLHPHATYFKSGN